MNANTQQGTVASKRTRKASTTVASTEETVKGSRKGLGIILATLAFNSNASNVMNMFVMQRGDNYMKYITARGFMENCSYPVLRAAFEADLLLADSEVVTVDGKERTSYPWGLRTPKSIAHMLAVGAYKTWQRRTLDFGKNIALTVDGLFTKFDKTTGTEVVRNDATISKKSVYREFDKKRAVAFLDSYLKG